MCVASCTAACQQQAVKKHHGDSACHDSLQGNHPAVPPDVQGAWQADNSKRQHEGTQPCTVLVFEGKPYVHGTGTSHHHGAQPRMQDGPVDAGPSC